MRMAREGRIVRIIMRRSLLQPVAYASIRESRRSGSNSGCLGTPNLLARFSIRLKAIQVTAVPNALSSNGSPSGKIAA